MKHLLLRTEASGVRRSACGLTETVCDFIWLGLSQVDCPKCLKSPLAQQVMRSQTRRSVQEIELAKERNNDR